MARKPAHGQSDEPLAGPKMCDINLDLSETRIRRTTLATQRLDYTEYQVFLHFPCPSMSQTSINHGLEELRRMASSHVLISKGDTTYSADLDD